MKRLANISVFLLSVIFLISCESTNSPGSGGGASGEWLIPSDQVFDGGPGQDGIPALENPAFLNANNQDYLGDNDLVIGLKSGNTVKAYPHPILDWHEIINDEINGKKLAITYCPLTGSAIIWNRVIDGKETTFGVSGLLYNTNLIPYDRETGSRWSQMKLECVNGELIGKFIKTDKLVETTWKTWKEMYPGTAVVSNSTGYARSYGVYPYGDYKTNNNSLLFPIDNKDTRLPQKERVFGLIVAGVAKAYRISSFGELTVSNDNSFSRPIVIVGSSSKNFTVAYERTFNNQKLEFTALENQLPIVMQDNLGNKWDIFGVAVEGPNAGQELKATTSYIAYWFAWAAFYPNTAI